MKLKVYMASGWTSRHRMEERAQELEALGVSIAERWWDGSHEGTSDAHDALMDIAGVEAADVFVALMDDPAYAYRGTFTELGAALALHKTIVVFTPPDNALAKFYCRTNTFFHHPRIHHVETWEDVLKCFGKLQ